MVIGILNCAELDPFIPLPATVLPRDEPLVNSYMRELSVSVTYKLPLGVT